MATQFYFAPLVCSASCKRCWKSWNCL